jgi:enoyl reductase-like protein
MDSIGNCGTVMRRTFQERLNVHDAFFGPDIKISVSNVEAFSVVVSNQKEKFKTARTDEAKAPMDFAIVTGWQTIMKVCFPIQSMATCLNSYISPLASKSFLGLGH